MLQEVSIKPADLSAYETIIKNGLLEEIQTLAKSLKGKRVLHLNATSSGGGVAELLKSLLPLMQNTGLETRWFTLTPNEEFFTITKKIHNFLQGRKGDLTQKEKEYFLRYGQKLSTQLDIKQFDLLVVHDPQPLPVILNNFHPSIWHCHIDTSKPNKNVWKFVSPFIRRYDRYIFTLRKYFGPGLDYKKLRFFTPAIDPLSSKNTLLKEVYAKAVLKKFGLHPDEPLITQVSRFDHWKDPWGVIDAYRVAKRKMPNLQLALIGVLAIDDPEGKVILADIKKYAKEDPNIFILTNLDGVGPLEVNAFQCASNILLQKSIKEGFGLTVSEALWKGKPVIGGNCGGITVQIKQGKSGYLVNTPRSCATKITHLLKNPKLALEMGEYGKETVREKFLMPRLLRDYLKLFQEFN
jgi:trehalose synthase